MSLSGRLFNQVLVIFSAVLPTADLAAEDASVYVSLRDTYLNARIEQLAVLADLPAMKKPYSVSEVSNALQKIQHSFPGLYKQISNGLTRYQQGCGITHIAGSLAYSDSSGEELVLPNARGERVDSRYRVSGSFQCQPYEWLKSSVGVAVHELPADVIASDTYAVLGGGMMQLEVGVREHWLSPLQTSAMLLSSNAKPSPSIGVSNPESFGEYWGFRYEIFVSRLERHQRIRYGSTTESGNPALLGMHFSLEPVDGWHISLTRMMQFGGGSRPVDAGLIWDAFIDPVSNDNSLEIECEDQPVNTCELGNQIAAVSSRFNVSASTPFSVYFEYAGEDTANHKNNRLGNIAFSGGLFFPLLWGGDWSLLYEFSEWQNEWYSHQIYLDGYVNDGVVMGHWGANYRAANEKAGAKAQVIQLGYQLGYEDRVELTISSLMNEDYASTDYHDMHAMKLTYRGRWSGEIFSAALLTGKDTQGVRFTRAEFGWEW